MLPFVSEYCSDDKSRCIKCSVSSFKIKNNKIIELEKRAKRSKALISAFTNDI